MSTKFYVCSGCCCGRTEKGNYEVPAELLQPAWLENGLSNQVELKITSCLGPCSMNNVTLIKTPDRSIWLGKLNTAEHFQALISLAEDINQSGDFTDLPDLLKSHKFIPTSL